MNDEVFVNLERALNLIEDARDLLKKDTVADDIVAHLYDETSRTISRLSEIERREKKA